MPNAQSRLTDLELKFLHALTFRTMMQSGFVKKVGDPDVLAIAQKLLDEGIGVQMAIIDESMRGQACPPLAFFYLEEDDVWAAVGEDVNVTFTYKPLMPILQTEKPKGDTTKPPSMPVQSAWDKAVNEALAADVCLALFAKLRNQRP
jgi:hypothetical protein